MEGGQLHIDGIDVFGEYGVYVTSGGWNALVAMPPLKTPDSNDWHEEDGIEADLSAPVLDTREATVTFAARGEGLPRWFDLLLLLSDGAYHEFRCGLIGRTYTLRLVSQPALDYAAALSTLSLKLADDFPLAGYSYKEPEGGLPHDGGYTLDGRPLGDYGARALSGTLSSLLSLPEVKKNLLRNIAAEAGAEYDPMNVTYQSKDARLSLLMRARTLEGLWRNWDALLYDLARPGERELWCGEAGQSFPCHYKSCSVSEFSPYGEPWLKFTLTLTLTRDFRVGNGPYLAAEDGAFVVTEDGLYIDMKPD